MENLQIFVDYISIIIHNVLFLKKTEDLRSKTRAAFSKYVPDDIIDNIIQQETSEGFLTGENRNVAILFSDIRDFTSISENNSAENVVRGLNNYFSVMVDIIKQEGGMIDKFIGDAILGIFGAPKSYEDNCARSLRAAIKMIQNLSKVNTSHMKLDVSGFKIGIGINYGGCILGNIGSKDKVDFTVIGDMVNLASRLEGLSKKYHHPIIVSDFLYNEVKSEFIFRQLDIVSVKGKVKPVAIYGVYSDFQTAENRGVLTIPEGLLINHNKALKLFYMKEWDAATEYFNKCLEESSEDYTAKMFLERIGIFKKTPPEGAWDGSVHLSEK